MDLDFDTEGRLTDIDFLSASNSISSTDIPICRPKT